MYTQWYTRNGERCTPSGIPRCVPWWVSSLYTQVVPWWVSSLYTLVCLPGWYIRLPASLPVYTALVYPTNTVMFEHGDERFIPVVEHPSVPGWVNVPPSPLRITSSRAEREAFWPRNPTQKAPLYKADEKLSTPPKVMSAPPPCYRPPFHTRQDCSGSPSLLGSF